MGEASLSMDSGGRGTEAGAEYRRYRELTTLKNGEFSRGGWVRYRGMFGM
jgi:hypothetical protein